MTINKILATGFFTGFSPVAPGTAGSVLALIIFFLLPQISMGYWIIIIAVLSLIGVYTATKMEEVYGHDASHINIDEIVGMFISVFLLPKTLIVLIAAFFLFRIFDVWKPFPINNLQSLPKGWGVMADDFLAGIYTNILLQIATRIF
jgi:phosphatidylglycerophosphatase A